MKSYWHSGCLASAGAATVLLLSPNPGAAQSNAELMDIIRQQQRQIEELSRKVDALEGKAQQATEKANAATEKANTATETANTATEKADTATETVQKVEKEEPDIKVKWAPGPTFSSKDGSWSVHVLGRLQVDGGALGDDDDFYKNDNATELRRARLGAEGNFYQGWKYRLEADFANSSLDLKDAYIEYGGEFVEPAYVRVGQYKTPNALEQVGSDLFTTFMEKAAIIDAFELDYQIGLGGGVSGDNWGVDAGLFGQNASEQQDNEGYALAAPRSLRFLSRPRGPRRKQQPSGPPRRLGALSQLRQRHLQQRGPVPPAAVLPLHRHAQRGYRDGRGRRRRRLGRAGVRLGPGPVLAAERVREHVPAAQARRGRRQQPVGRLSQRQLFPDRRAPQL